MRAGSDRIRGAEKCCAQNPAVMLQGCHRPLLAGRPIQRCLKLAEALATFPPALGGTGCGGACWPVSKETGLGKVCSKQ
jgi:hypothetical protein